MRQQGGLMDERTLKRQEDTRMSKEIKTIGVLTSGGDAPGMNAAIRAVVRKAISNGVKVKGIKKGYQGLLNEEIIDLDRTSVSDTIQRGGTILGTARCSELTSEVKRKENSPSSSPSSASKESSVNCSTLFAMLRVKAETAAQTSSWPSL